MNEMKEVDSMTGHCTDKECYHWLGHKYFGAGVMPGQASISYKLVEDIKYIVMEGGVVYSVLLTQVQKLS